MTHDSLSLDEVIVKGCRSQLQPAITGIEEHHRPIRHVAKPILGLRNCQGHVPRRCEEGTQHAQGGDGSEEHAGVSVRGGVYHDAYQEVRDELGDRQSSVAQASHKGFDPLGLLPDHRGLYQQRN
eukprot:CAMPEP_0170631756 /NCGR_PEP_ID=MMETSP0224-20130122/34853_1 /TAXON_ID=285029 /ORGANISM="Togula jolla, Strain CCCM 725" /LENGTH=124 /DNA_ID=CAMNT_0010960201 /DNA_START=78 /DNA_END=449 /DNA_ORIENTATION=+